MIKVGMIVSLRGTWHGGVNYFKNLLNCYQKNPDPDLKLDVFTPDPVDALCYKSEMINIHPWPVMTVRRVREYPRRAARRVLGYDPVFVRLLERNKVNLLTYNSLGKQTSINTLHWQPDFQHKRLPQFFSLEECKARDAAVADVLRWGNILLSSNAAAGDFRRYYPELSSVQAHVLRFSTAGILDVPPLGREELEAQYPVREPYFFLPNQFWQHKNHAVVVEALRRTSPEIRVVCTGSMQDYRDAVYVPALLEKVKQAGLEQRFVCLGNVPYPVAISLMHHSIAVVQPSLFEGWSTTVEESKAMRKQIILSNIDVHVEQAPQRGVYFSPDSPEELAVCLTRVHAEFDPTIERRFAEQRLQGKPEIERGWIGDFARIMKMVAAARR